MMVAMETLFHPKDALDVLWLALASGAAVTAALSALFAFSSWWTVRSPFRVGPDGRAAGTEPDPVITDDKRARAAIVLGLAAFALLASALLGGIKLVPPVAWPLKAGVAAATCVAAFALGGFWGAFVSLPGVKRRYAKARQEDAAAVNRAEADGYAVRIMNELVNAAGGTAAFQNAFARLDADERARLLTFIKAESERRAGKHSWHHDEMRAFVERFRKLGAG